MWNELRVNRSKSANICFSHRYKMDHICACIYGCMVNGHINDIEANFVSFFASIREWKCDVRKNVSPKFMSLTRQSLSPSQKQMGKETTEDSENRKN